MVWYAWAILACCVLSPCIAFYQVGSSERHTLPGAIGNLLGALLQAWAIVALAT